jgi:hypothetical protein
MIEASTQRRPEIAVAGAFAWSVANLRIISVIHRRFKLSCVALPVRCRQIPTAEETSNHAQNCEEHTCHP